MIHILFLSTPDTPCTTQEYQITSTSASTDLATLYLAADGSFFSFSHCLREEDEARKQGRLDKKKQFSAACIQILSQPDSFSDLSSQVNFSLCRARNKPNRANEKGL
jgi:hypothetical protein